MTKDTFTLTGDDDLTVLTMSRPHCLDIDGKHALLEILRSLGERKTLRTVIIAANDPEAWLVDVAELVEMTPHQARALCNFRTRRGNVRRTVWCGAAGTHARVPCQSGREADCEVKRG